MLPDCIYIYYDDNSQVCQDQPCGFDIKPEMYVTDTETCACLYGQRQREEDKEREREIEREKKREGK